LLRPMLAALVSSLALGLAACSKSKSSAPPRPTGTNVKQGVRGQVTFQKRTTSDAGLSGDNALVIRPARHVTVQIGVGSGGVFQVIAATVTDTFGEYGIGGDFPADFRVLALSESPAGGDRSLPVRVVDRSRRLFAAISAPQPAVSGDVLVTVDVQATIEPPDRIAGAFNIIDSIQRAAQLWLDATGVQPVPATVNWESGNRGPEVNTSFFQPGLGPFGEIFVLGGVRGMEACTDTDEFDDAVICHEYGHFLVHNHSTSSSPGGPHGGENLVPNLAYDEGMATWFGGLAIASPLYHDTIGNQSGRCPVLPLPLERSCGLCENLESSRIRQRTGVVGIGSEQSCYELLWDLTDGAPGAPPDQDGDGVAIPPEEILRIIAGFHPPADYPYIVTIFERLEEAGLLPLSQAEALMRHPVDHDILLPAMERDFPPRGRDLFPVPITLGQALQGRVDSRTRPPGGLNIERGFDSIRYYSLTLTAARTVTVMLTIEPGGGEAPQDLDLFLLDLQNRVLGASLSRTAQVEEITRSLFAGRYIIAVFSFFDTGSFLVQSAANYLIEVR
jgi:hypothetical protein